MKVMIEAILSVMLRNGSTGGFALPEKVAID
jgi:hypothetical protein